MTGLEQKTVYPSGGVRGSLKMPGDKSISHRAALLSAISSGESVISNFLLSEDCLNTLHAMELLGAHCTKEGTTVKVMGMGPRLTVPARELDMGNSGTGMRLLAGVLAGQSFTSVMTGDKSLCSRPMRRIKEPLEMMGASVDLRGKGECAPIVINGGRLKGITYELPVASAQVKSCILLAGLFADGQTVVTEPRPSRDHTERMLAAIGVGLKTVGNTISLEAGGVDRLGKSARRWIVPGDFSSAAFWITAAACSRNGEIELADVGLNPRRTALLNVLRRMGAEIHCASAGPATGAEECEPYGVIRVSGGSLKGTVVGGDEIPALIDELPLVAVAGALAEGETVIRDAAELRVKESDRIQAMVTCLRAFGVNVTENPDGMVVKGPSRLKGEAVVESLGDHRIAMAAAVLGLSAEGPTTVRDTACVGTSYPGFWDDLKSVGMA